MSDQDAPRRVLLVSGCRQVGKDTLYLLLERLHPMMRRYAFADPLRHDLAAFIRLHYDIDIWTMTGPSKELVRPYLITHGMAKRVLNPDHWVDQIIRSIKLDWAMAGRDLNGDEFLGGPIPVVVDCRFSNEVGLMRATFGDRLLHVDLTREGSPPPTDEENRHYREVAALADHRVHWGTGGEAANLVVARQVATWAGLSLTPASV